MALLNLGKCVLCEKDVEQGKWECFPGQPHEVEKRKFHVGTGVDKVEDRVKQRVKFYFTPDVVTQDAQGNRVTLQAESAEFVRGFLETGNPKLIMFLDGPYKKNLISAEEWEKQYINPQDLLQMKQREFEQKKKVGEAEHNELLEKIRLAKEELAAAKKAK
jgi:hypothetical protein